MWLSKAAHLLERFGWPVTRVFNGIGSAVLGMMMLLSVGDVLLRYFLNRPIPGTFELTEFMMVVVAFFAVAYTATQKGHVAIEVLVSRFPQRAQAISDSIAYFISIGFFALVAWQGFEQAKIMQLKGDVGGVTSISVFPFLYVISFGSAMLCLVFLTNLLDSLGRWLKK